MLAHSSAVRVGHVTLPAREWRGNTLVGIAEVRQIEPTRLPGGAIGYVMSLVFDRSSDGRPFAPLPVYRAACEDPALNGILAELAQEMLLHPEVDLFTVKVELADVVPDRYPGVDRRGRDVLCPAIDTATVRRIDEASADGLLLRCFRPGGSARARRLERPSGTFPAVTAPRAGSLRTRV